MQPDYFYESAPGDRMLYMPRPAARSSPTDNYQLHFSYICNRLDRTIMPDDVMAAIRACAPRAFNLIIKKQQVDHFHGSQSGYGFVSFPTVEECMTTLDKLKGLTIDSITFDCSLANRSQSSLGHRSHSRPPSYGYDRQPYDHSRQPPYPRPSYPSYPYPPAPNPQPGIESSNYLRREANVPGPYSMSASTPPFTPQPSNNSPASSYYDARGGGGSSYPPPHQQQHHSHHPAPHHHYHDYPQHAPPQQSAPSHHPYQPSGYSMPPYEGHSYHQQSQPPALQHQQQPPQHAPPSSYPPRERLMERFDDPYLDYQPFGAQPSTAPHPHSEATGHASFSMSLGLGQQPSTTGSTSLPPSTNPANDRHPFSNSDSSSLF